MKIVERVPPKWAILLEPGITGSITATRSGDLVTLDIYNVALPATSGYSQVLVGVLPPGLRASQRAIGEISKASSVAVKWTVRVEQNGIRLMRTSGGITEEGEVVLGQVTYRTNDPL